MATMKIADLTSSAMLVAALGLMLAGAVFHDLHASAELERLRFDNDRLRDELSRRSVDPIPVVVTCECPEYEEGWEDAEFVEGCAPEEISVEELRDMCSDLEEYGYVPDC
jgi:hypothetical protein